MIYIAICDDEEYYIDKIQKQIELIFSEQGLEEYRIDTYLSGEEFCSQKEKLMKYQAVFLDISMQGMNGMEAAGILKEYNPAVLLVFITAYIDFSLQGYRLEALRYIIKDMLELMLPECVEAIIRKLNLKEAKVEYTFVDGKKEIGIDSLYYVESDKHQLRFCMSGKAAGQYVLYDKLDNVEDKLRRYGFLRIHKSYLVNIQYIDTIEKYAVRLKDNTILPIPRQKYQTVKAQYYAMKGEWL